MYQVPGTPNKMMIHVMYADYRLGVLLLLRAGTREPNKKIKVF